MTIGSAARSLAAILLLLGPFGCRRDEPIETRPPTPEAPPPRPAEPEPPPAKPVALELSASGGCALDSAGELWCWGGYATRHPGLRSSVPADELLVASRVEFGVESGGKVHDFAVTDTGVCWLGDDGAVRCHLGEGIERHALGDAISFVAATDHDGDNLVVVQLDHQTLHSNVWPEARQYGSLIDYDLAGSNLCVQLENRRIACDRIRSKHPSGGGVSRNAFTRAFAVGPSTMCSIEDRGVVECTPPLEAMSSNIPSRWIEGIDDAVSVDVGQHHACSLGVDGKVVCFGSDGYFQRGEGIDGVATVELPGPATAVAAAGHQSCAIVGDEIFCWGAPAMGLADRWISRNDIALDSTALHVSGHFNCVSRPKPTTVQTAESSQQSKVWCWGSPNAEALGWATAGIDGAAEPRPVALPMLDIDMLVGSCFRRGERVACGPFRERGKNHAGLATEDFTDLWAAEANFHERALPRMAVFTGFMDDGKWSDRWRYCGATRKASTLQCASDRFAEDFAPVPGASVPKGPLVVGPDDWACTFTQNTVTCFGIHTYGEPFRPARSDRFGRVRALAAGELGWFALDVDGRVWNFEVDLHEVEENQLDISDPVLVPIADVVELGPFAGDPELCVRDAGGAIRCITRVAQEWSEVRVELDHGALELDAGIAHACARVDDDGDKISESIHCWGDNRFAQLGSVGAQVVRAPTPVSKR